MNRISLNEILEATGGRLVSRSEENEISGVWHDSRECGAGDMFVAIIGENQDGHKYIAQVAEKGCRTVLVSHEEIWPEELAELGLRINAILVDDTVFAMGELAAYYLSTLNVRKIAVTGSVGKTSTRDMIYYALKEKYNCGRNLKNYNNDIGLPISVFQFDSSTEAVVLEMGMSEFGEISRLSSIVKPDIGVITNIGVAHIERLGSREGIFRAKMELAENIAPADRGGTLVFARDDEFLTDERTAGDYRQLSVGMDGRSDYIISDVDDFGLEGIKFTLEYQEKASRICLPLPGTHNASNAALAIAVAGLLDVDLESAAKGLLRADLTGSRLKKVRGRTVTVIDDTYNANPDSMISALKVLEKSSCSGKHVAVLGDMFELGENSSALHFNVGIFARGLNIDRLVAVGEEASEIARGAEGGKIQVDWFRRKEDFYPELKNIIGKGDMVLVKASRGMKMEDIVERAAEL